VEWSGFGPEGQPCMLGKRQEKRFAQTVGAVIFNVVPVVEKEPRK